MYGNVRLSKVPPPRLMELLHNLLRRLIYRSTPAHAASSAPASLPDNWLTDVHFDPSRLTLEQREQKATYHEGEANRLQELADREEAEFAERDAARQDYLDELESRSVDVALKRQRLLGALQYEHWVGKLSLHFGEEVANKLANHEIEPGMTQAQLVYTYGVPEPENIAVVGERRILRYGNEKSGAYFEVVDNIITQVAILTPPPYPPHAFEDYDEAAALED